MYVCIELERGCVVCDAVIDKKCVAFIMVVCLFKAGFQDGFENFGSV